MIRSAYLEEAESLLNGLVMTVMGVGGSIGPLTNAIEHVNGSDYDKLTNEQVEAVERLLEPMLPVLKQLPELKAQMKAAILEIKFITS